MIQLRSFLALFFAGLILMACEETPTAADTEFSDWQARNISFFREKMREADTSIRLAKQQYGEAWEAHCNWRILPNYAANAGSKAPALDSICAEVIEQGSGSGSPLFSDYVRVQYLQKLIPSASYPTGRIVAHSGYSVSPDDIFSPTYGATFLRPVSNHALVESTNPTIAGETTAYMHMRIGDHWRIYSPYTLARGPKEATNVPAYSTLISEVRLTAYYRNGEAE